MSKLSMVFAITWCTIFMHLLVFPTPTRAVGDEALLRELKDVSDSAMSQWNAALLEVTASRQELTAQLATHEPDHPTIAPMRQRAIMAIEAVTRAEERFSIAEGAVIRVLESIDTVASSSRPAPQDRGTEILPAASNKKATGKRPALEDLEREVKPPPID